ncbi:MAG: NYN domain-containing protein [Symploca sp. SIO2E6]|nr:NYN domain-containing protein [Symploca sp. SIO2E6]
MPDNDSETKTDHSKVIHSICLYIYQTILEIQEQHPELLKEKYRNVLLQTPRHQATLLGKLQEGLNQAANQPTLLRNVQKFLQILLTPNYFQSPSFGNLMAKIRASTQYLVADDNSATSSQGREKAEGKRQKLFTDNNGSNGDVKPPLPILPEEVQEIDPAFKKDEGIAILLLDAENLQLDPDTENFLVGVCRYPLQIKIAFANWRTMGKQDAELHRRGYELIHVPAGKDSADVKMATVGSSIFVHYPTAREVFVCSSDKVLTHLCNTLQTHGLTVYSVCKQGPKIRVLNRQNSHSQTHSLLPQVEIPSLDKFISQLQEIITAEQNNHHHNWVRLSKLSQLYKNKYNIAITQVVAGHLLGKRARDLFLKYPAQFVIHQPPEQSEIYITVFPQLPSAEAAANPSTQPTAITTQDTASFTINSRADLEQSIVKIVKSLTAQSPESYIDLSRIATEFNMRYDQNIKETITRLQLKVKFVKLLHSCSALQVKQEGKVYKVAIASNE